MFIILSVTPSVNLDNYQEEEGEENKSSSICVLSLPEWRRIDLVGFEDKKKEKQIIYRSLAKHIEIVVKKKSDVPEEKEDLFHLESKELASRWSKIFWYSMFFYISLFLLYLIGYLFIKNTSFDNKLGLLENLIEGKDIFSTGFACFIFTIVALCLSKGMDRQVERIKFIKQVMLSLESNIEVSENENTLIKVQIFLAIAILPCALISFFSIRDFWELKTKANASVNLKQVGFAIPDYFTKEKEKHMLISTLIRSIIFLIFLLSIFIVINVLPEFSIIREIL